MARVRLAGVGFSHADATPLFSDLEIDLAPGWTALAGPNGAGKTTLLGLVAGELAPSHGHVAREPADAAVAICRQMPERASPEVVAFAFRFEGTAPRTRARFGLDPDDVERWETLSPGERQRWQVAAALDSAPEVLLLDEPTNHLDVRARALMGEALRGFRGIGVIVAHDRAFLDALVSRTLWVDAGEVTSFSGTYSQARAQMRADLDRRSRVRREQKKELGRVARELDARNRRLRAAEVQLSTRVRMKGPKDSDARSILSQGKAELGAAAHARSVATMRARVEASRESLEGTRVVDELGRSLFVDWVPAPRSTLMRLEVDALVAGARTLLEPSSIVIERDARIHVAGDNGAGKTTLLGELVARWTLPPGRLLYLPQDLAREDGVAALERVRRLPPDDRGRVLSLVAALGVEPARLLASSAPSPGEARKLLLAEGLARRVWCVFLDEPTNHLDVPSIERLEAAMAAYPGALVIVTHDAELARRTTRERWTLREGRLERASADALSASASGAASRRRT
jgi:ATPase subunit of ABC transporter with duplicated ATPase domains